MALSLRLPYDVKDQRVRYTTLDGAAFVPPYGDIHHRTETLEGISDGDLLVLWAPSARWRLGIGTSLPLGHTVPDPIALGLAGRKHEHLQFGSGVFAPEAEAAFQSARMSALLQLTVPLSENDRGFRAPRNLRWSIGPTFGKLTISAAGQYQTIGRWHGAIDEGTGFSNGGVRVQYALPLGIAPSVYREIYSRGLNDETFSQGTTFGLTVTRRF